MCLMACSIVSDLMVGFGSLFRVEVLGGRDRFLMGCKAKRDCWMTLSGLCLVPGILTLNPVTW